MYQGVDIADLSGLLGRPVYSGAHHGAGVYDFLMFTERVPRNSEVIMSISKFAQIREKRYDYNRSGLSFWALRELYNNNYSASEITTLVANNLRPRNHVVSDIVLYEDSDSMEIAKGSIERIKSYYKDAPTYLTDKQRLYIVGIKNLVSKNCKISFVEFPCHPMVDDIENQSPIIEKTEHFKHDVISLFKEVQVDTLVLSKEKNIYQDLSHLNSRGAKDLSEKLGERMKKSERTTLYIVR